MNKIKQIFKGDKEEEDQSPSSHTAPSNSSSAPLAAAAPAGGASAVNPDKAEGVVLHTTLGAITIALYPETPKVHAHRTAYIHDRILM